MKTKSNSLNPPAGFRKLRMGEIIRAGDFRVVKDYTMPGITTILAGYKVKDALINDTRAIYVRRKA